MKNDKVDLYLSQTDLYSNLDWYSKYIIFKNTNKEALGQHRCGNECLK